MTIKLTLEFSLPAWLFSPTMPPAPRGVVVVHCEPAVDEAPAARPALAKVRPALRVISRVA